jgi:hypothetical protein
MQTIVSKTGNTNLSSQYTLSLIRFLSANSEIYKFKASIHGVNMGNKLKLHKPSTKLKMYQKEIHYSSIKICNQLPDDV